MILSEHRLIGYTTAQIKEMQQKAKTPAPVVAAKTPAKVVTPPLSTAKPVVSSSGIDPNRGTRGTAVPSGVVTLESAKQFGSTLAEQQATLQKRAQDEYTANGSVTPETQAYLDRLNPENAAYFNQTRTLDAQDARDAQLASARDLTITKTPSVKSLSTSSVKPYSTSDLQSAVEKRKQTRLAELGIKSQDFAQVEDLLSKGYKYNGTENNQPVFTNAAGEKQTVGLNEAGVQAAVDLATTDLTAEVQGEQDASVIAEKEQARATKSAVDKATKEKFIAGIDTSAIGKTKSQIDGLMNSIKGLDPSLQQAILPSLIQLQQTNSNIEKQVNDMIESYPTDAELEADATAQETYARETFAKYEALLAKNNQTELEVAKYNNDALKIEKQIIDHDAAVSEQKQMAANVDNEKKLRRQLNRLGIQTDLSGLTFLQTEIQKGADALNNLKTSNNLVSLKAQLAIGEGYRLEVKQAMEDYEGKYLNIVTQTQEKVASIKNSMSLAKADRAKGIIEAKKWGLEQKQENDKETRSFLAKAREDMDKATDKKRDDERAQETLGWSILNTAIDNYGSLVPQSIIDSVSKMLPAGTNIQDIIKTPTFAERANKRISGSIGSSGTGSSSGAYNISPTTSAIFSGVTSGQLREAVDRVTLSFGGTGEERNRKRGEYLDRIASGENPASIMTSMQNDYWVSQKGAEKTRHDERTGIADSMDALQAKIDYYGQDTLDEEALGFIQSKTQALGSYVGLSSDTYNDIASYVGNIRAKIVKENYGSAVTEQELALARSYIPDLTKPASQFAQNVYNLKSYNQYLDAKSFASNVGLPAPKPPAPITLSGGGVTGTAKYSPNDILNALK